MKLKELKFGLKLFYHPAFVAFFVLLLILPIFVNDYVKHAFIMIFFYAFLGLCWDICGGYSGLFSIGHAGFLGIGAYASSFLFINLNLTPWIGMFVGAAIAAIMAMMLGWVTCRYGLIGVFFALASIALGECLRILVSNAMFLNGPQGLLVPFKGTSFLHFQFNMKMPYYYIMLGFLVIMMMVNSIMEKSKLGYYLIAIREDEQAADALGINLAKYKIIALAISAAFTAIGGTFYSQYVMFIEPSSVFTIPMSVEIITRPIIGGLGTVLGPVVGSFFIGSIGEITRLFFGGGGEAGLHLIIYGVIIILVVIFIPAGIINLLERMVKRIFHKRPAGKKE